MTNITSGVYKVSGDPKHPEGLYGYVMDIANPHTNSGEMSALYTASTPSIDRSREIVETKGIDLTDHKLIPNAFLGHIQSLRVGQTEDRLGKYTMWHADGPKLKAKIYYDQTTKLGNQTFVAVHEKRLRGASIGFIPKPGMVIKATGNDGHPVTVYKQCRLVEISVVPTPDNPECIAEMVYKGLGGKPLCPELDGYLRPLCPERQAVVTSGWDGNRASVTVSVPVPTATLTAVEKKYKGAEPKEVSPQYRNPHYYTCPHCGDEMTPESIYREAGEKGHTRHGSCGGSVIMKPAGEGEGTLAVGSHPRAVLANLVNGDQSIKTLGQIITSRLQHLRSKAMQTVQRPRPKAPQPAAPNPAAEFAPVDDPGATGLDPNDPSADPNAAIDPHDDHRGVVDEAVGNVLASIYDKFTSGQIDMPKALNLFELCLTHHGDVTALDEESDPDAPLDLDDEPDPEDLDDEGDEEVDDVDDDEADAPITDADHAPPPRKKKPPREKFYREYTEGMERWITKGYRLCGTIIDKLDNGTPISQTKLRRVCEEQIETAETLEPIIKAIDEGVLVTKAKPSEEDAWAEEVAAQLAARNAVNVTTNGTTNGEAH